MDTGESDRFLNVDVSSFKDIYAEVQREDVLQHERTIAQLCAAMMEHLSEKQKQRLAGWRCVGRRSSFVQGKPTDDSSLLFQKIDQPDQFLDVYLVRR